MNPKAAALIAFLVAGLLIVFLLKPPTRTTPLEKEPPPAPWELPLARHLLEHDIRIGPTPEDDLQVTREGPKIRVEIRPHYLEKQPEDFLSKVGFAQAVEMLSEDGFHAFLETLHMTLPDHDDFEPEGHGHTHEHDPDNPEEEGHKTP